MTGFDRDLIGEGFDRGDAGVTKFREERFHLPPYLGNGPPYDPSGQDASKQQQNRCCPNRYKTSVRTLGTPRTLTAETSVGKLIKQSLSYWLRNPRSLSCSPPLVAEVFVGWERGSCNERASSSHFYFYYRASASFVPSRVLPYPETRLARAQHGASVDVQGTGWFDRLPPSISFQRIFSFRLHIMVAYYHFD